MVLKSRSLAGVLALGIAFILNAAGAGCSCASDDEAKRNKVDDGNGDDDDDDGSGPAPTGGPPLRRPSSNQKKGPINVDDPRSLVYLFSRDNHLYSFSPKIPGQSAYRMVGKIGCKARGTPQSMAVDRDGFAWVFYDSAELFKVSVTDASCSDRLKYSHPARFNRQLGMGFTSAAPGSPEERLFIMSPEFGLGQVQMPSLNVAQSGKHAGAGAELTGGADARLFFYAADSRQLSEVDLGSFALKPVHTFTSIQGAGAWAFARYAGHFYIFTSIDGWTPTRTTEYDPKTNIESVRDASIGFTVVGAGQSILAPPPDTSGEISGTFP